MKIPPVKGTRDFYPDEMAIRNWIIDGWKRVSIRNGFEEYDGPIFEYLKMFQIKSGEEIGEQLFSLKDRGGRELALRPEITPTLARMVNQKIKSLARPIKWFSVPRLFRAERPQKGRLREFFQWNVDIIGEESVQTDAETIFCAIDYLQNEARLTPGDFVVKISSRKMLAAVLKKIGIPEERLESLYPVLDKKNKLPSETFKKLLNEQVSDREIANKVQAFMKTKKVSDIKKVVELNNEVKDAIDEQTMLIHYLDQMSVSKYCEFDPSIVRGLAYYTGIIYEIYDKGGEFRAIGGGGRYDNLLKQFGGPDIPATGFGIGDCVLEILLREKGLINEKITKKQVDFFVIPVGTQTYDYPDGNVSTPEDEAITLTAELKRQGYSAESSYRSTGLSKQLKEASTRNARKCIIIGDEYKKKQLLIKDMASGEQEQVDVDTFFATLKRS